MDGIYANLRALLRRWSHDARWPTRRLSSRRCLLHLEQLEERRVPTVTHTYIVTTTAYSTDTSHLSFNSSNGDAYNTNGAPVSLFEALTAIDAVSHSTGQPLIPGPNVIDFDVAGSGVHVFALPAGTANPTEVIAQSNTTIKGYSQPGSSANTGTGTSDNAQIDVQFSFALDVAGSNTAIKGVALPALALGAGQGNQVMGDFVGITPGGASMSSSLPGVTLGTAGSASTKTSLLTDDTVGDAAAGDRNVISGHLGTTGYGVAIVGGSSGNSVQNNLIGTNLAGTAALSNAQAGVYFDASATSQNAITGNVIAFNHGDGIQMAGGSGAQFNDNSIFANAAGIMLAATANNGIVAPVFTHWNPTSVTGELTKFVPGATYTLDFYNNTQTDSAGHYEGQTRWAIVTVTPNSLGQFTASVTQPVSGGLTATVTDSKGDTSAFSAPTDFNISSASASASALSLVEGTPATNFLFGTIRDGNPNTNISQLQAVVSWGDGTQATLTSQPSAAGQIVAGASGTFLVRGSHTYAKAGTYHITATVTDRATGASNSGINTTVQVAHAPLSSTSLAISPVALSPFQGEVAIFTETNPSATVTQFTATLNWGDGTTTTGTVTVGTTTANGTTYQVSGGHTYNAAGQYSVTVTIQDADGGATETSHSTTVAPGPMTPDCTTISATEGTPFTGTAGHFTVAGPGANPQYTAVITWGNGQTTTASTAAGTIVVDPVPTPAFVTMYSVKGTDTYAAAGTYPVSIVVTGPGLETATINSTADVADAPLSSTSVGISGSVVGNGPLPGLQFTSEVATFTEQNPSATAAQFTATINWGDGTTTAGTVTAATSAANSATFDVEGSHTYLNAGTYPVTVAITDSDGGTTTTTQNTTVYWLEVPGNGWTFQATAETPFTRYVGQFVDLDPNDNASTPFTATINWGDGHASTVSTAAGTITNVGGGNEFLISGTHTYAEPGIYPISVVVTGPGSATTPISLFANVADVPLSSTSVSFNAAPNTAFNGVVATFSTGPNSVVTAGQFTATINWGDGVTTMGTVNAASTSTNGPTFNVTGSHTYANLGTYAVTVTITDSDGGSTSTTLNTTVSWLLPTNGTVVNAYAQTPFAGVVGSFVDTNPNDNASTPFTATINWGNGQTTTASTAAGTIQAFGTNEFRITGTNTYAANGTYPISMVVTGPGSTTPINSTADVATPPLYGTAISVQAVAGTAFTLPVATFTDAAGPQPLSDYTAWVSFGDFTPAIEGVITLSGNTFTVTASHTYAGAGTPSVVLQITDTAGATLWLTGQASVAAPPPPPPPPG